MPAARSAAAPQPALTPVPSLARAYGLAHGFAYRTEDFGGILYHYEGVAPDPRVTFVDNRFLVALLDVLRAHPGVPLDALIAGVAAHFGLEAPQRERIEAFFAALIARGALVPLDAGGACAATPAPAAPARPAAPLPAAPALRDAARERALSAPITVTWEVTNRCNLRCTHCLSDSGPEASAAAELSLAEAKAVVEQLAAARVFQIHFGGGEPFVYPGFMELLRHAQAHGFCCLCISTNGALLDDRRIAALEALGGIYLQLSLDGASEAACDALRGPGTFRKVLAALERLQGTSIVRTLNFVYTRGNAHELDAMRALAHRYGATLRVTRLKPSGRGAAVYGALRPTQAQLAHLHGWLQAHGDVLTGDTFFHLNALGGAPLGGFAFCGAARMTCLVTPNGDVFPCAFTQNDVFRAGNLRRQDFADVWATAPVFERVFRQAPQGACAGCSAYNGCGGGCPAVKHAVAGRLDIPDPDCVLETARGPGRLPAPDAPLCAG